MTTPTLAPCEPWCTEADFCAPCDAEYGSDRIDETIEIASWLLFEATRRQFPGQCTTTVRPCVTDHHVDYGASMLRASVFDRRWAFCGCGSPDQCGCGGLSQVRFGGLPIVSVDEVKVDGEALGTSAYRVDDWQWLVRLDGDTWPCCQRLDLPSTEEGTFEVTYTFGRRPPTAGIRAAAVLACELLLACDPSMSENCRLPRRVTSITRQGVQVAMSVDPMDYLDKGRFGIFEIDAFIAMANGAGGRPARVWSPDVRPTTRHVGT